MKNARQLDSGGQGEIYYTTAEVCEFLKISEPTLWRKCKFHGLNKVKAGGLVRYRKSVVDKWITDHETGDRSN
jgi:excisionase family DNA binding protein